MVQSTLFATVSLRFVSTQKELRNKKGNERFSRPSLTLWYHVVRLLFSNLPEENSASISDPEEWGKMFFKVIYCTTKAAWSYNPDYLMLDMNCHRNFKSRIEYRMKTVLVNLQFLCFQALPRSLTIHYHVTLVAVCQAFSDVGWGMWALPWSVAHRILRGPPKTPWMKMLDKLVVVEQNLDLL